MWEHKLKNCILKTAARTLDDFFIFFIAARKRSAIKCSLYCQTDTIMYVVLKS